MNPAGTAPRPLPPGPVISFYGDDFTGAAAVGEILTLSGLPTVVFTSLPTPDQLLRFADYRGVGLAGTARSEPPEWMAANLPRIFRVLSQIAAPIAQYKICSTLDSSPSMGSIGAALDIGTPFLGGGWHPFVVAAPPVGRYQVFGNLFAASAANVFRLDRHPTMSNHPTTPMDESDVRRHLSQQTDAPISLIDILDLKSGAAARILSELRCSGNVIAFDVLDQETLCEVGRLVWELGEERVFAIASQGLEYALVAYWRSVDLIGAAADSPTSARVESLLAASGSCSETSGRQIEWAAQNGFEPIVVEAALGVDEAAWGQEIESSVQRALHALSEGRSPILCTARGPGDPSIARLREAIFASGARINEVNTRIGRGLGAAIDSLIRTTRVRRVAFAGGDTSGHIVQSLKLYALTLHSSICPGGSLFLAHSEDFTMHAVEIAMKGGQMGPVDYFGRVRNGSSPG